MNNQSEIFVEYLELPGLDLLEQHWTELEARSDASFFTSWSWIGCWLKNLPGHIQPRLLRATDNRKVVGLGLLVHRKFRRHKVLPVNGLFLHSTGDALIDDIYIEYNGFLVDRALRPLVLSKLFDSLAAMSKTWDELYLCGVTADTNLHLKPLTDSHVYCRSENVNYVDLGEVRLSEGNYPALLGSNTRYNIRRSIKEFSRIGPIKLNVAKNLDEAFDFFSKLKELHQTYWRLKGEKGSFANSFFESFHNDLIQSRFDHGEIQLIQANAGDFPIGYLYNFIHSGVVYNYQSGFNYSICKSQFRPGYVTHSLAIALNASMGQDVYDFMAGDSGYKQALGTHTRRLDWLKLQRNLLKFRLENRLRHVKRGLHRSPGAQSEK